MRMLLHMTGHYCDDVTHDEVQMSCWEFYTEDLDDQVMARIENCVWRFVNQTEATGVDAMALFYKHMAEIAERIGNCHDGNPDRRLSYAPIHIDDMAFKTLLWVGPAE